MVKKLTTKSTVKKPKAKASKAESKQVVSKQAVQKIASTKKSSAKKSAKKIAAKKKASEKSVTKRSVSRKPVAKKATSSSSTKKQVDKEISESLKSSEQKLKQVWLAGMGAYGLSVDTLQEKVGEMRADRKEIFESLVERGEKIQDETNEVLAQKIDAVEGRITKIKQQLTEGYSSSKIAQGVEQLASRLEQIKNIKR